MSDPNYVVGRGKLYFEQFAPGTTQGLGELYLGNTPSLRIRTNTTTVDRYESIGGVKVKAESVTVKDEMTVTFEADDIKNENLAAWFGGVAAYESRFAEQGLTQTQKIMRGRIYQIGKSSSRPQGARNITNFTVRIGQVVIPSTGNWSLDPRLGRLTVLDDAVALMDGSEVTFTFDIKSATALAVVTRNVSVRGALRFISDNIVGLEKNYFFPLVKLSADQDFMLKGDDWQSLGFTASVMRLNDATERMYVDADPLVVGPSPNEEQALQYGTEAEIIAWVNAWYQIDHVRLPSIVQYQAPIGTDEEVIAWVNQFEHTIKAELPAVFN